MIERIRNSKHLINTLIVMAIFLNAIAPLSIVVNQFLYTGDEVENSFFGDKILICTPAGFKYISFEELKERQNNEEDGQQSNCPLCQINKFKNDFFTFELNELIKLELPSTNRQYFTPIRSQNFRNVYKTNSPRAPPVLF